MDLKVMLLSIVKFVKTGGWKALFSMGVRKIAITRGP
jgi:hypothetical protein